MPDELAALAEHAELADDSLGVLEFAPAAADRASRLGAHREAAAQYERCVRFSDGLDRPAVASLLEGFAYELHLLGDNHQAQDLRSRASTIWRNVGNSAREADNVRWRSRSMLRLGKMRDARRLAKQAIDMLEALPAGGELAWAYGNQAHIMQVVDHYREALSWALKALSLAKRLGDQELVVFSLNDLGTARLWLGDHAGRDDLLDSARLAIEYGLTEHLFRAQLNLAAFYVENHRPMEAETHLAAVSDFAGGAELDDLRRHMLGLRALCRTSTGRWDEAIADANQVADGQSSLASTDAMVLGIHGRIAALTGRSSEANQFLDRALARAGGAINIRWHIHQLRAEAAWLRGDQSAAASEATAIRTAYQGDAPTVAHAASNYWWWRSGQRPTDVTSLESPFSLQVRGEWREAANEWTRRGCPYEAAMAQCDSADPRVVRESVDVFDRIGAVPAGDIARRRLRELGVHVPRRRRSIATRSHPLGLTPRQAEVLELISIGLTNPKIAQRLFVSRKTVEHHVTAVLSKLGAANRTEAARLSTHQVQGAPDGLESD